MIQYILTSITKPNIIMGVLVDNVKVGGIKLVYSKSKQYSTTDDQEVVFLKPYKEVWAKDGKKSCRKGEYGNTLSPFTNVWLRLTQDYNNFEKDYDLIHIEEKVTNPKLIKYLNRQSKNFKLDDNESTILTLKDKTLFMLKLILLRIKNRIINQKSK